MMMMIGKNFGYIMIASLLFCQSILLVMTVNCPMVNGLSVSDTNNIMKNSTKPTGNYTNGTSLVRVKALQTIKSIPQLASQIDSNKGFQVIKGQNLLNNNLTNINGSSSIEPNLTTKEEVQKAEEQANVMLKPYFDKLNQQSTPGAPPLAPTTDVPLQQQQQPMTQGNEANNMTGSTMTTPTISGSTFLTYTNPILGLKIQYPSNWLKMERPYNLTGNSTIVSFFSPLENASSTGKISGVSGAFVPYVDIFVFDSKNMSLNELINATINNFANANLTQSNRITINGNNPAYMLFYNVAIGGDEFKKLQVWTINGGKVYVITYNSQSALYSNYLPIIQKMIKSLEITSLGTQLKNSSTTKNQESSNTPTGEATSSGNTVTGIPGVP
jgi:hypothetical protein